MAPEIVNENEYNEKCDIWSCGVILYLMLNGVPPFFGKTTEKIFKRIKKGDYIFQSNLNISDEAKSFIEKLLEVDPIKRFSARQALLHPWLNEQKPNFLNPIDSKVLKNLINFSNHNKIRVAIMSYITFHMTSSLDKNDIISCFNNLDKNKDGKLSRKEILEDEALNEVDKLFKTIDIDYSGEIDFSEFIVASIEKEKIISARKLNQAFNLLDNDNNGYLTKEELVQIFGNFDENIWKNFLNLFDINNDGKVLLFILF